MTLFELEEWLRGLRHRFRKPASPQGDREFKSHLFRLRHAKASATAGQVLT